MAIVIKLPKMSDTMEEGVIVSWQVKVGDQVKSGDILAEVETDKATMDLENYDKGTILHINAKEGDAVPVDSIIAIIGKPNEDFAELLISAETKKQEITDKPIKEIATETLKANPTKTTIQPTVNTSLASRVNASPLARKMATDKGIDLININGTGDGNRIVKRDIESYVPSNNSSQFVESYQEETVSQMRKTIARRLGESKFSAPHFYLTMNIKMDEVMRARKEMNDFSDVKISVNDIIIKATSIALKKHPKVNSSWLENKIRFNDHIHIGVAMAVEDGLLVPVVKFADKKNLSLISTEVKEFSGKAKAKKLQPADWEGNTFTISNLGMFGIEEFTAIINPPDACILAVGAALETVVAEKGEMKIANVMKVTLSCDHRVVDGVVGSKFLLTLKELLEQPFKLLV